MKKKRAGLTGQFVVLAAILFVGITFTLTAQSGSDFGPVPRNLITRNPAFASNPAALELVTNLLAGPAPELSVPEVSSQSWSPAGTYWTLKNATPPLPFDPFPDLPVYAVGTNNYVIDDRSVDYPALALLNQAGAQLAGLTNGTLPTHTIDTNGLWLEFFPDSLTMFPGQFIIILHNTIQGQSYDVLTKSDLLAPTWAVEQTVTRAVGNGNGNVIVRLPINDRTNLFVWARLSPSYSFHILTLPLSQYVYAGDDVTFSVETGGNTNLTFQWTHNGVAIDGATNSSYAISGVQDSNSGAYAVIISDGTNSLLTAAASLWVEPAIADPYLMRIISQRQNYTFKSGITYYIDSPIQLYGNTIIEGGAVLKFHGYYDSSLVIMGSLTCKAGPYFPAVLTSVDDNSIGPPIGDGFPQTAENGVPYLELANAKSYVISNLRISYADWGVTTPVASRRLDVWDCQFVQCNYGVVNLVEGSGSTDSLHNVLFSACGAAVGASINSIAVEAEQVMADVADFCLASSPPGRIALTNSIILGNSVSAQDFSTVNVAFNPDATNFQPVVAGNYYLAANSPLHGAGMANISPRLQMELQGKSTCPPMAMSPFSQNNGAITLSPQVPRYTNGAPDLGYYYDALDYTVANMTNLPNASITVLPGTAIGFCNIYVPAAGIATWWGFTLREGSSFISHGTPAKPITYVDVQLVQEQLEYPCVASFVPDYESADTDTPAPMLDFRFCHFYAGSTWCLLWAGNEDFMNYAASPDSLVNWTMRDCALQGGWIWLGPPTDDSRFYGSGAILWVNNSFDGVNITLYPTYYWMNQMINCDLSFKADNNLFRNGQLRLLSMPASAGNWTFTDNLFDKVSFMQYPDLDLPLDHDHNGYWPCLSSELGYLETASLAPINDDGGVDATHDVELTSAPPYEAGPLGNYYLLDTTPLYGAGSCSPADAGLYQYTTRLDQTKEGGETSGHMVNIGVHYIAANSYGQPLDTDGDGIPDYVENWHGDGSYDLHTDAETDWQNAMTDGMTNDIYNALYDDIDLSGDGLTGRAKRILGINPLSQDNPLKLTPLITGQEPYILTYSMPLSINVESNQCVLTLLDNGKPAGGYAFTQQTNSTYLIVWNNTFASYGSHILQVQLSMPGATIPSNDTGDIQTVNLVFGASRFENVSNLVQFDPDTSMFIGQAWIYGTLQMQSADYEIDIYDMTNNLLKTITNHTDNGVINEVWDLTTDTNQPPRNDQEFNALVYVTPTVINANNLKRAVRPNDVNGPPGIGIPLPYHLLKTVNYGGDAFTMAYGWNTSIWGAQRQQMIQNNVVNVLFNPGADNAYNPTFLNCYDCYPFFMGDTNAQNTLLDDLGNCSVGNFYWFGHGSFNGIGSAASPNQIKNGLSNLSAAEVATRLNNLTGKGLFGGWKSRGHPYRLVILDSCDSAGSEIWAKAFGIYNGMGSAQWLLRNGLEPQAFVGWVGPIDGPVLPPAFDAYGAHLYVLFDLWMSEVPLDVCVGAAATPFPDLPFWDMPMGSNWKIFGCPLLTRTPQ